MPALPRPEIMSAFRYINLTVPPQYHCGQCGTHGVKLWRLHQTFLNHQSLLCAACAIEEQTSTSKRYEIELHAPGAVSVTVHYNPETEPELHKIFGGSDCCGDQIGGRIPAVPTEDGTTYWGYSSVPAGGCVWWEKLLLRHEGQPRRA